MIRLQLADLTASASRGKSDTLWRSEHFPDKGIQLIILHYDPLSVPCLALVAELCNAIECGYNPLAVSQGVTTDCRTFHDLLVCRF